MFAMHEHTHVANRSPGPSMIIERLRYRDLQEHPNQKHSLAMAISSAPFSVVDPHSSIAQCNLGLSVLAVPHDIYMNCTGTPA